MRLYTLISNFEMSVYMISLLFALSRYSNSAPLLILEEIPIVTTHRRSAEMIADVYYHKRIDNVKINNINITTQYTEAAICAQPQRKKCTGDNKEQYLERSRILSSGTSTDVGFLKSIARFVYV